MTGGYLLDTNVISETRKIGAEPRVTRFLQATNADRLFLSVLTLGELRKGVALRRHWDAAMADRLALWGDVIEGNFADRVIPLDVVAARLWGELSDGRRLTVSIPFSQRPRWGEILRWLPETLAMSRKPASRCLIHGALSSWSRFRCRGKT